MGGFDPLFEAVGAAVDFVRDGAGYGVGIWVLVIVLSWSGLSKLRRPTRAALAIADFGLVSRPLASQGVALGMLEFGLAILLVSALVPSLALALATALFAAFVVVVAHSLIAGERFPCYCFGGEEGEIGALTVVRATLLAILAALLLSGGGRYSPGNEHVYLYAIAAAAWVAIVSVAARYRRLWSWNEETVAVLRAVGEVDDEFA